MVEGNDGQRMAEQEARHRAFAEAVRGKQEYARQKEGQNLNMVEIMEMYDNVRLETMKDRLAKLFDVYSEDAGKIMEGLGNIVFEMRDGWDLFDAMLSDDSSARLVTLFFKRIADNERKKAGICSIPTKFVVPPRDDLGFSKKTMERLQKNWQDFFDTLMSSGKIAIITEHISSGRTLRYITQELHARNIAFEIVVFSIGGIKDDLRNRGFFVDVGGVDDLMHVGLEHDARDRIGILAFYRNKANLVQRSHDSASIHPQVNNDERERGITTRECLKDLADFMSEVVDVMEEQQLFDN